ncbi:2-C-methyl-D-erythritol 2,4-cyclodiphosphate synthase [Tepiditoga spiralis]|uniref:2-C-methyl-D-erythritol 2,4-cyclodiphosphate synthase n=1 Tax=Tepiditoga spiralis TaxID=2108365 RepID=A0A7G1G993_9BACT|nr:2-C-methyl-D-erythritol 2,4-cyclodiphosphate synthase [Tepiditoga spiralis]BBE30662.1 2-C-methyl-D-erythritol 2,4-cyclodiphosphate synthase [Tepiditoga spiralis]
MLKVGFGYDVHPLIENRKLILGGVEIENKKGLDGHSDGDVFFHAVIDGLLGLCGMGSIGELFPETQEFKDANSYELLKKTYNEINKKFNLKINNIDSTIVSKSARISNVKEKIKENTSKALNISINQINVKGKSGNTLGVAGKDEGIEVYCIILANVDEIK